MSLDDKDRCGVGLLSTGSSDPFSDSCTWHDKSYMAKEAKKSMLSRRQVDRQFLRQMLLIAGDNRKLRARAYFYYYAARLFGGPLWKW